MYVGITGIIFQLCAVIGEIHLPEEYTLNLSTFLPEIHLALSFTICTSVNESIISLENCHNDAEFMQRDSTTQCHKVFLYIFVSV